MAGHDLSFPAVLGGLVDSAGEPGFDENLLSILSEIGQFEHVLIYEVTHNCPSQIMAVSSNAHSLVESTSRKFLDSHVAADPLLPKVRAATTRGAPQLFRADVEDMPHRQLYDLIYGPNAIRERIVLSGHAGGRKMAASLVRPGRLGLLTAGAACDMIDLGPLLLSLVAKHISLVANRTVSPQPFASLNMIETAIRNEAPSLTSRQVQVCARILKGLSTSGVALDLGIGEETVVTHRKQAYQRLGIASRFELGRWYMAKCAGIYG